MEAATRERHSHSTNGAAAWEDRTRVFLTPIAPPSILGLFGFAAATFIVAAHLAGWYGSTDTPCTSRRSARCSAASRSSRTRRAMRALMSMPPV